MKFLAGKINYILCLCLSVLVVTQFPDTALSQTKTIIAFGDSLTEGCDVHILGYSLSGCGWMGGYGYENALTSLLVSNGYSSNYAVYNYGMGGETTADGVNRIDSVLDNLCNQDAGYILLMEGTNDLLHHAGWPEVQFNLGVMIDKSRARGIEPLLATLTPDPDHDYKDIPLMNEKIRELATLKEVILVDQYNALAPDWDVYTNPRGCYGDLLHPNYTGFDAMGNVWYTSLSELLPRPKLPWLMLLLAPPSLGTS